MAIKPRKLPTLLLLTDNPLVRAFFEGVVSKIEDHALIIVSSKHNMLVHVSRKNMCKYVDEKL